MGRLWGRDVAEPKPAPSRTTPWSTAEAAAKEAQRLWGAGWPAAMAVVRHSRIGTSARKRRAHLVQAGKMLQQAAPLAEGLLAELRAGGWGAGDDHAEWGLAADRAVLYLQEALLEVQGVARRAPTSKALTDGAARAGGEASARKKSTRMTMVLDLRAASEQTNRGALEPAAYAFLAIASGLEPPCTSDEEWAGRRDGWKKALQRARAETGRRQRKGRRPPARQRTSP